LQTRQLPSRALVDAVAVAKVRCVENSIAFCHRLKQEVGSFALMSIENGGAGFEDLDFLQCW
jgi:acyl-CoA oxidase